MFTLELDFITGTLTKPESLRLMIVSFTIFGVFFLVNSLKTCFGTMISLKAFFKIEVSPIVRKQIKKSAS